MWMLDDSINRLESSISTTADRKDECDDNDEEDEAEEETAEEGQCIVCLDEEASMAVVPCGHLSMCSRESRACLCAALHLHLLIAQHAE